MTPEIQNKINQLQAELDLLKAEHTIPFDVENAFRVRLKITLPISAKGASTEDRAVNESGSSSYNVLKSPDGFLEATLSDGTIKYIPYYD